ncbi:NusG domain II-containing protein [Peptococcus simiae]|uniref:NusG domain II-containing protein n=1 Tax=Peptococcus simiae TaxID=1643805 RepID=UPI0039807126
MPKSNKKWLTAILALLVISGLAAYGISHWQTGGHIAKVYLNDKVIRSIDLDKVKKAYTFRVDGPDGHYNIIEVSPGAIRIKEANCPDQICVNQGAISNGVEPIVCLPHRLMIKIDDRLVDEDRHDHTAHDHAHHKDRDHGDSAGHDHHDDSQAAQKVPAIDSVTK